MSLLPAATRRRWWTNWRGPLVTIVSMTVAVIVVAAIYSAPGLQQRSGLQPGPLILAAALAMTTSRNRLVTTWRGRVEALVMLPVVGLAVTGVAELLRYLPWAGAAAFTGALFLSIWLRRFGPTWSRVGTLIALPFITLLIVPGGGAGTTVWGAAAISVVVLVIVVVVRLLAEVTRLVPRVPQVPREPREPREQRVPREPRVPRVPREQRAAAVPPAGGLRPIASTRMAIQLAIALAAAFVLGALVFPEHVTWVVLTAFLVCSGNRGRADVLYKSGLRIVGAAAGTIIAGVGLAFAPVGHPLLGGLLQGPLLVALLLGILGLGLWLREWSYAAWALAMTLVITLLQGVLYSPATSGASSGASSSAGAGAAAAVVGVGGAGGVASTLWERVLAIVLGAALGLVASWFVLPIRSESVVRRRVADALAALSDFLAEPGPLSDSRLAESLVKLDEVALPWQAWERVSRWRTTTRKPGEWMRLVHESAHLAREKPVGAGPDSKGAPVRRALGEARRSMRDPLAIGPALTTLRDALRGDAE